MGQFMYIACLDCKTYQWLDKLSLMERKDQLIKFMRYEHPEHTFKLIGEDQETEKLLEKLRDEDECPICGCGEEH